jgi:hypothetical protein
MRTVVIIAGGLILLGAGLLIGRWMGGPQTMATIAKVFVALWLALALLNMWAGVSRAGYTVGEEFPIFLVIFVIPAGAALLVLWKLT